MAKNKPSTLCHINVAKISIPVLGCAKLCNTTISSRQNEGDPPNLWKQSIGA